jgi:predicted nucleotidyltransferase component of viral defense system
VGGPVVLQSAEARAVASAFGVAHEQVRRDHFLSHLIAALAAVPNVTDRLVFFGGTALARTHLVHGRLSEDIDLLALTERRQLAADIEHAVNRGLRRPFGALQWTPPLRTARGSASATVSSEDGLGIRVQLLSARNFPAWPTEVRDIEQRYSDVAATRLRVLTLAAFVAAMTSAWAERSAARDLYDLNALAELGAIDQEASRLYVQHGPTGSPPADWVFTKAPTEQQWRAELAAQTTLGTTATEAFDRVREAWAEAGRA